MDEQTENHLGGYTQGGDPATYFPELWKWLVSGMDIRSVLDIGCGEGHSLKYFREQGCNVWGLDGVEQEDSFIELWDFTKGPWHHPWSYLFDLVWMCEFVEHLEEQYIHNVVSSIQAGKLVLMTHAFPGQAGHHHVNCRDAEYWKGFMAAAGFTLDKPLTDVTRSIAALNENEYNHYLRSGMAFRRNNASE